MGDKGFPALMRAAKRFKPRGKGHEVRPPPPPPPTYPLVLLTARKNGWDGADEWGLGRGPEGPARGVSDVGAWNVPQG